MSPNLTKTRQIKIGSPDKNLVRQDTFDSKVIFNLAKNSNWLVYEGQSW